MFNFCIAAIGSYAFFMRRLRLTHFFCEVICMKDSTKTHICCFTGHRPEKLNISEQEIKSKLNDAIDSAICDGFTTFISGMARGVDMWAAEIVLSKRIENSSLRLICESPFKGVERSWNLLEQKRYNNIIKNADSVVYLSEHYYHGCFQIRNCHMVNNSSRVISVYTGECGGTHYTVKYAQKRNIQVINVLI